MKRALITGVNGQDGSHLAEFLLKKGYEVFGLHRRGSTDGHLERVDHLKGQVKLVCADLCDLESLNTVIEDIKPHEIYNLAAQSHVGESFKQPHYTKEVTWLGVERLLHCIKKHVPSAKFYQASTSELFGAVLESPQSEKTPFNPVSPYAEAKLHAHLAVQRERRNGIFACTGILFNHEGERRGLNFVTRKITDGMARIKLGIPQRETGKVHLELGNLNAKRDWGYAGDYVEAMWMILQNKAPGDYVIATGETRSVRDFVEAAAKHAGLGEITWKGEGINEKGYDANGQLLVAVNPDFFRPNEVHHLIGDPTKAKTELGWEPKVSFSELVRRMVDSDFERLKKEYEIEEEQEQPFEDEVPSDPFSANFNAPSNKLF